MKAGLNPFRTADDVIRFYGSNALSRGRLDPSETPIAFLLDTAFCDFLKSSVMRRAGS